MGSHAVPSGIKVQRQMHGRRKIIVGRKGVAVSLAFNVLVMGGTSRDQGGSPRISEGNFGWPHGKQTGRGPMGVWPRELHEAETGPGVQECFLGYSCCKRGAS